MLYLHGFRSSPRSFKAQLMGGWIGDHRPEVHWWCPLLPPSPREAMAMVFETLARWPVERMAVVGSSLGGFYATVVAERTGCRAVLLNPAINPARDLAGYIGDLTSYHNPDDHFYFKPEYVTQLRVMTPRAITRPERYFAVVAKGDEVLDWREMTDRYDHVPLRLIDGSDHAMSDFEAHLPHILRFLGLLH
ncbi:MAG: esterase [Aquincola sp.]|nr:esterase [Aquincola sp.]